MDKWYFQLMKNTILKALSFVISLFIFMQAGHASTGVKDLLDEYHYAVTVEWDQKDETFIQAQEDKLLIGLENALATSVNPENVVKEILAQIPDQKLKADITQAFTLFKKDEISKEQILTLVQSHQASMNQQGTSWSPVMKIIIGVVVGYVVLKALMLVIYYWDTDPDYGTTENPPKPIP
jgi:hypothetical protein